MITIKRLTYKDDPDYVPFETNCVNGSYDIWEPEELEAQVHRLWQIEDILGDEYDLDWLRKLMLANSLVGKEVWGSEIVFRIFGYHEENIQRATIQYVSILKDRTILCHTKTCAIPIEEFNKTIFLTKDEAVRNVKQNPGKN